MKKYIAVVLALLFSLLTYSYSGHLCKLWRGDDDSSLFALIGATVENDILILKDGRTYPKIKWKSDLHRDLGLKLGDLDRALAIYNRFQKLTKGLEEENSSDLVLFKEYFAKWLKLNVQFIGSPLLNDMDKIDPSSDLFDLIQGNPKFKQALSQFFRENQYPVDAAKINLVGQKTKVLILTTLGGGGHLSAAQAIQNYLKSCDDLYEVTTLDSEDLKKNLGVLWIASGKWTGNLIWGKIYQQQDDPELGGRYYALSNRLKDYIPWNENQEKTRAISAFNPDIILATCHFHRNLGTLAYGLTVPLLYVWTDFLILDEMRPDISSHDPKWVRFGLPSVDSEIFSNIEATGRKESSQSRLSSIHEYVCGEIDFPTLNGKCSGLFCELGFPTREVFQPIEDPNIIAKMKVDRDIEPEDKVVLVAMGAQGVGGKMLKTVRSLYDTRYDLTEKVSFVLLCGKNEKLKSDICDLVAGYEEGARVSFIPVGFLDEQDMADYLNVADLYISKPGGSTVAESMKMNVPMLLYSDNVPHWEEANGEYVVSNGFGRRIDFRSALAGQVMAMLNTDWKSNCSLVPTDWKRNLKEQIQQMLANTAKERASYAKSLTVKNGVSAASSE